MDQTTLRPPGAPPPHPMSREEFYRWSEGRDGRYELLDGRVIRMNAETAGHVLVKMAVWMALRDAVRRSGLEAEAFGDGVSVAVDDRTNYEPDALVNLGPRLPETVIAVPNPVIVVEVGSPGTQSIDVGLKFNDYFRVPSIQHYLIVSVARREVAHHRRVGNRTEATVLSSGPLHLDPPGITITVEDFFVDLAP